jgi:hypothetical protein
MSPIERLRLAIEAGDTVGVCEAFSSLTGQTATWGGHAPGPLLQVGGREPLRGAELPAAEPAKPVKAKKPAKPVKAKSPEPQGEKPCPSVREDFTIQHTGSAGIATGDGRKACRLLPMDTPTKPSAWVDDGRLFADEAKESRRLSKKFKGRSPRPEYQPVRVTCARCGQDDLVHPDEAPIEDMSYIHTRCLRK